jgi:hypothetical protein
MKKLIVMAAFAVAGLVNAQENIVKANPLALLGGTDLLSYEFGVADQSTIVLGVGYGGYKLGGADYTSFGGEAQYRYYFSEKFKGWYGAGRASFSSGEVKTDFSGLGFDSNGTSSKQDFTSFGAGVLAGYQWVFDSGFVIDLNLGAAYSKFDYKSSASNSEDNITLDLKGSGILPTFGFGLGYAF